ncbi:MAG: zinc-dependent alcohol dehydrogenase family protein [Alphaproteobacteria bacterium]|nr:zinc-dependent alcohol dehydrogenase family protein [Alphaproteobacteria bacterium]
MRALVQVSNGEPANALVVEERPDPVPGPGQIVVAMEIAPIHRSDLFALTGGSKVPMTSLPRVPGAEGVGRVVAVGQDVTRFKIGDRVWPPKYIGLFQEQVICTAADVFRAPDHAPPDQLAILCTMGLTAIMVLDDYVREAPGGWIIHNGANSSIGMMVIGLAHARGLKTVNIVRRAGFENKLRALGGDAVVIDDSDPDRLATRVAAATGGAPIHTALDVVGSQSGGRLAHCLTAPGALVLYGGSGGSPAQIDFLDMMRKELTVVGMSMSRSFNRRTPAEKDDVMRRLGELAASGHLKTDIAATYSLDQYRAACEHAAMPSRDRGGKVLFRMTPSRKDPL